MLRVFLEVEFKWFLPPEDILGARRERPRKGPLKMSPIPEV